MSYRFLPKTCCLLLMTAWLAGPVAAEEVSLPYEGMTLNAELTLAPGKSLADGVILIVHGTQAHKGLELIQGLQERFLEQGRSSLAVNLSLGIDDRRGLYDCTTPSTYTHENAIGEIAAWVDWLEARGARNVVLTGHSRGASQILWYATEHDRGLVDALVLLAPGLSTVERETRAYRERFDADLEPLMVTAQALVDAGEGDTLLEHVPFLFICRDTAVTAESFVSHYGHDPRRDTPYWLDKVRMPTLVILGQADTVIPELGERIAPFVDGERIRVAEIDGAGHFFRDLNLDDAVDEAIGFIESVE